MDERVGVVMIERNGMMGCEWMEPGMHERMDGRIL